MRLVKLHILGQDDSKLGGAWSWIANMRKCFPLYSLEEADTFLITSVSMLGKVSEIPWDKKVILRVDNVLKKSTNRDIYGRSGDKISRMEAMREIAKQADMVIYQSNWSKELLHDFLNPARSKVILNSSDESIFTPEGSIIPSDKKVFFYSRSSNHDNKQWHMAYYEFQKIHRRIKNAELWIAGRFSDENIPNNFDFFNGENIKYLGFIDNQEAMALYFRSASRYMYTYAYDCCSNTLIEALLCGCQPIMYSTSGGAKEIVEKLEKYSIKYFHLDRMKKEYEEAMNV